MEVTLEIKKIEKEDLVNLLSTSVYGSTTFALDWDEDEYRQFSVEGDCYEDVLAKMLLAGKTIFVLDFESEECSYGNLPHEWDVEEYCMKYTVGLEDIKKGIAKAFEHGEYARECVTDFINDNGNLDLSEVEELLQWIVFGESVYG